ncbi:MAG: protease modulator HflC [Blastomonas sp.]
MSEFLKRPMALAVLALVALVILASTVVIVPETKQVVIVRFGEPVRTLNRYRENEEFGKTGAGLIARIPFAEQVVWVDKRVLDIEMEQQQVLSTDQLRLEVDAYARYRIVDPRRMYVSAGSEERVSEELRPILGSALRNELGKRPFAALLSPERGGIMARIQAGLDRIARQYGAKIIDVQIKRADLPQGTPLDSAFQRMRTARQQEARTITAQGQKNAQIIRAEADATAARTYAESFGKDAQFYEFYRAMQSYERTFLAGSGDTTLILSPNNDYLRQFEGR